MAEGSDALGNGIFGKVNMTDMSAPRRWEDPPRLPSTHYVDSRIYTDPAIFAEEQARIFAGEWKLVCHESELPQTGDYRVVSVAGRSLVVVRGENGEVRSFYNTCAHRGAELVRDLRGNLGRAGFRCFYHLWTYDLNGRNTWMTRPEGYESCGLKKEDYGLRPVRTERVAGLVFVSLRDDVEPLETYLDGMLGRINEHLGAAEFEVTHHHSAVINANWKFWNENNTEVYHEFLHILNRKTMVMQPGYHNRRWALYRNGHASPDQVYSNYEAVGLEAREENLLPGIRPSGLLPLAVFPDVLIIFRATILRIDTMTPLSPDRTLVEWRGLGLKGDSPEVRAMRLRQHNQVWGPAGRNLAEDVAAVESQQRNVANGASRYNIIAREENFAPHDDCNLRAYYQEWGRRVGRWAHNVDLPRPPAAAESESTPRVAHG